MTTTSTNLFGLFFPKWSLVFIYKVFLKSVETEFVKMKISVVNLFFFTFKIGNLLTLTPCVSHDRMKVGWRFSNSWYTKWLETIPVSPPSPGWAGKRQQKKIWLGHNGVCACSWWKTRPPLFPSFVVQIRSESYPNSDIWDERNIMYNETKWLLTAKLMSNGKTHTLFVA